MRTLLVLLTFLVFTPLLGLPIIIAGMLGVRDRRGGIFDRFPRWWTRLLCLAAGVRVRWHGEEHLVPNQPYVFASNHVSWFDVFVLASHLPHYKFVAKSELERIPLFGQAVRAAGFIFIDRNNRKAAFAGYEVAAQRIRSGCSVVVCPEGTRGRSYALRPFKKGPFVLAIAAGVPVVPTVVHGTREVQRKGSMIVRSGEVDVHFLPPIPTAGLSYDDRDAIAGAVWQEMAREFEARYAIQSHSPRSPVDSRSHAPAAQAPPVLTPTTE